MNIGIDIDGVLTNDDDYLIDTITKYVLENKMKFDFVNVILDTNTFKNIYTLDKFKFKNKVKPLNMVNQL